eukprot:858274-Heterocapsa_arctica.AAC.1
MTQRLTKSFELQQTMCVCVCVCVCVCPWPPSGGPCGGRGSVGPGGGQRHRRLGVHTGPAFRPNTAGRSDG